MYLHVVMQMMLQMVLFLESTTYHLISFSYGASDGAPTSSSIDHFIYVLHVMLQMVLLLQVPINTSVTLITETLAYSDIDRSQIIYQ